MLWVSKGIAGRHLQAGFSVEIKAADLLVNLPSGTSTSNHFPVDLYSFEEFDAGSWATQARLKRQVSGADPLNVLSFLKGEHEARHPLQATRYITSRTQVRILQQGGDSKRAYRHEIRPGI